MTTRRIVAKQVLMRLVASALAGLGAAAAQGAEAYPAAGASVECAGAVGFGDGGARVSSGVADRAVGGTCLNGLIVDRLAEGAR